MSYQTFDTKRIPLTKLITKPAASRPKSIGHRLPQRDEQNDDETNETPGALRNFSEGNSPVHKLPRVFPRTPTLGSPVTKTPISPLGGTNGNDDEIQAMKSEEEPESTGFPAGNSSAQKLPRVLQRSATVGSPVSKTQLTPMEEATDKGDAKQVEKIEEEPESAFSGGNHTAQKLPRVLQRSATLGAPAPAAKSLYPALEDPDGNADAKISKLQLEKTKEELEISASFINEKMETPPVDYHPQNSPLPLPRVKAKPTDTPKTPDGGPVTLEALPTTLQEIHDEAVIEAKQAETRPLGQNKNEYHFQGIQGHAGSSFLDAAFFALFSYCSRMDHIFHKFDSDSRMTSSLKKIIRKDIVSPLRWKCFVPLENMLNFREKLAENARPEYLFTSIGS